MRKVAYHVPTRADFERQVQPWLDEKYWWGEEVGGVKYGEVYHKAWNRYKEDTCVYLDDDGLIKYNQITYLKSINYKIMEPKKTLENAVAGDFIQDHSGDKRKILSADGEGESTVFQLSQFAEQGDTDFYKMHGTTLTLYELKEDGYKPVTDDKVVLSMDEVAAVYNVANNSDVDVDNLKIKK